MGVVTEEDFTHLVTQHHAEIYRYLVRVTGRVSDADDLSQAVSYTHLTLPTILRV